MRQLKTHLVNGGQVEQDGDVVRLIIPPTSCAAYTDAQLDDYEHALPHRFINHPPQQLRLRARCSHPIGVMKGTAGFGFWNHPFTREGRVIEPPRNAWFFYSSPESDMRLVRDMPGHGFKAATLDTPLPGSGQEGRRAWLTQALIAAGNLALKLPGLSRPALALARRMVTAHECPLDLDLTCWHDYALDWQPDAVTFRVDGRVVLHAPRSVRGPLGLVAWVDNYCASATADGHYAFAYVDVPETQWMEIEWLPASREA